MLATALILFVGVGLWILTRGGRRQRPSITWGKPHGHCRKGHRGSHQCGPLP